MSKPRYRWWGYVRAVIRAYPGIKERRDGAMCAKEARWALDAQELREYEAVTRAIELTLKRRSGRDRLRVIDMVLWKQSHTIQGAAMQIPCAWRTAAGYHGEFIHTVAFCLGLKDCITQSK